MRENERKHISPNCESEEDEIQKYSNWVHFDVIVIIEQQRSARWHQVLNLSAGVFWRDKLLCNKVYRHVGYPINAPLRNTVVAMQRQQPTGAPPSLGVGRSRRSVISSQLLNRRTKTGEDTSCPLRSNCCIDVESSRCILNKSPFRTSVRKIRD